MVWVSKHTSTDRTTVEGGNINNQTDRQIKAQDGGDGGDKVFLSSVASMEVHLFYWCTN